MTGNDATVSSGTMYVSGATVDKTIVKDRGSLYIDETGKADSTTVGGSMVVSGTAENTTINGGEVHISSGGTMTETKVTTTDENWGSAIVSSGGTAIKTTVDPNGVLTIYDGGSADVVTVAAGGWIYITEGATATNITAADGAKLSLTVAPGTYAQGTYNDVAFDMKDGILSGYTARYDDGVLYVVSGGVATDITVKDGATVFVAEDGVLDGITLTGGYLTVYEGGKVTGKMRFNDDDGTERVWTYNGAIVDFDLTRTAPGDEVLVNNLAAIKGNGKYTLTVDGTEKNGVYNLADGASDFNKTITVMDTDGETLGYLWVNGEAQTFDDVTYQLARAGSTLTLTVSGAPDLTGNLNTEFTLTDGMRAKKVNVLADGMLIVSSGAVANKTTIKLIGGMCVYSGGVASNTTAYFYFGVDNGGKAIDTTICEDGFFDVVGTADNTTILAGGSMSVVAGGVASDTTVKAGGALNVEDGGKLTGKMTFETGAAVKVYSGATIDFDLTQTAPDADALLNDFSAITFPTG